MGSINSYEWLSIVDDQRASAGFHRMSDLLSLQQRGNLFLDPFTSLISCSVQLGKDNLFYGRVVIEAKNGGHIEIGDGNIFYPNCLLLADQGRLIIGSQNQLGDGGFTAKANMKDSFIQIGNKGRYLNNPVVLGKSILGSGSQVIGAITVQDCTLMEGESHLHERANERGGVLKGMGLAREITVSQGQVINGLGDFQQSSVKLQSQFHSRG